MAFIRINQIKDADGSIEPDELELANDIIEAMMITTVMKGLIIWITADIPCPQRIGGLFS